MSHDNSFARRLGLATGAFFFLFALLFTVPALIGGDTEAFKSMLLIGIAMSFAVIVALLLVALPLWIVLGGKAPGPLSGGARMSIAGAVIGFLAALYPATTGNLSTAGVVGIAASGALLGWLFAARSGNAS